MKEQFNAQMAELPQAVHVWMNWMMGVFLASILFVWKRKPARVTFVSFLLTMPLAMGLFKLLGTVNLLGIVHFLVWLPLLVYLYKKEFQNNWTDFKSPYRIWLVLLCATILISLVFDIRDIVLVLLGQKS